MAGKGGISAETNPAFAPIGCWTCKDRRVRCDRTSPHCLNCTRVRRKCQGYGVRLSWPKANNTKRAMLGNVTSPLGKKTNTRLGPVKIPELNIIHTSFWDVEMHRYLMDMNIGKIPPSQLQFLLPDLRMMPEVSPWNPCPIEGLDRQAELIHYFATTAVTTSLAVFNSSVAKFGHLLIQMALSNSSLSSKAVLFAILAISSQHRDGLQSQAIQFATSAISALAKSAENGILDTAEAAQHVAANMLLCTFELQTCAETTGRWLLYLRAVKDIIQTHNLNKRADQTFVTDLLDWVYYHDVVAQFSVVHWRRDPAKIGLAKRFGANRREWILGTTPPLVLETRQRHHVLQFLSSIVTVVFQLSCEDNQQDKDTTTNLVNRLKTLEREANDIDLSNTDETTTLYYLAARIYLLRVSSSISSPPLDMHVQLQSLRDQAFTLLRQASHARITHFLILILGNEARTDEQRIMILDILRHSEEITSGRITGCVRLSLCALWIQEDLLCDVDLDSKDVLTYADRLTAIISQARFIPSLLVG